LRGEEQVKRLNPKGKGEEYDLLSNATLVDLFVFIYITASNVEKRIIFRAAGNGISGVPDGGLSVFVCWYLMAAASFDCGGESHERLAQINDGTGYNLRN